MYSLLHHLGFRRTSTADAPSLFASALSGVAVHRRAVTGVRGPAAGLA